MKIVLDTNVLMSGLFFGGKPCQIIDWWLETNDDLLVTDEVLEEYKAVLERLGRRYPDVHARALLQMVMVRAVLVETMSVPLDACSDSNDLKFLACARSGQSDWLISGDQHLLRVDGWQGIRIISPADFVKLISSGTD
jgi:putative PIN family toxin of toxin-antitoxin system